MLLPITLSMDLYDSHKQQLWLDFSYDEYKRDLREAVLTSSPLLQEMALSDIYRKLVDAFRKLLPSEEKLEAIGKDYVQKHGNNFVSALKSDVMKAQQVTETKLNQSIREEVATQSSEDLLTEGPIWDKVKEVVGGTVKIFGTALKFIIKQVIYMLVGLYRNPLARVGIVTFLTGLALANFMTITETLITFFGGSTASLVADKTNAITWLAAGTPIMIAIVAILLHAWKSFFMWLDDPNAAPAKLANVMHRVGYTVVTLGGTPGQPIVFTGKHV